MYRSAIVNSSFRLITQFSGQPRVSWSTYISIRDVGTSLEVEERSSKTLMPICVKCSPQRNLRIFELLAACMAHPFPYASIPVFSFVMGVKNNKKLMRIFSKYIATGPPFLSLLVLYQLYVCALSYGVQHGIKCLTISSLSETLSGDEFY